MNIEILGAVETLSIADGYRALDAAVKAAPITIIKAEIINPGKFLILISGDIASVEMAMDAAVENSGESLLDHLLIQSLDDQILSAVDLKRLPEGVDALGIIESVSVIGAIEAADRAVKETGVKILSIRTGTETGGRGILLLSGTVGDVEHAAGAAKTALERGGRLYNSTIIPGPHADLKGFFSGN